MTESKCRTDSIDAPHLGYIQTAIGGAIRMIKLFGWEDKIEKRIGDRRLDELKLLRKQRLLVLWNVLAMYVSLRFV